METIKKTYKEFWGYHWRIDHLHAIPGIADWDRNLVELIRQRCGVKAGDRVLDLGCGGGDQLKLFAAAGCRVTGVDYVPALIAFAEDAFTGEGLEGEFITGDMLDIGFDAEFDLCLMLSGTFGIVPEDRNRVMLERIYLALKPGGQAFIDYLPLEQYVKTAPFRNWYETDTEFGLSEEWFDVPSSTYRSRHVLITKDGRIIRAAGEPGYQADEIIRAYGNREIEMLAEACGFTVREHLSRKHIGDPGHVPEPGEPRGMLILRKD